MILGSVAWYGGDEFVSQSGSNFIYLYMDIFIYTHYAR